MKLLRKNKAILSMLIILVMIFMTSCGNNQKYKVCLITMDKDTTYWNLIDEGCQRAVKELGEVNYSWIAPIKRSDKLESEEIDRAVSNGANAIIVSAVSLDGLNESLKKADEAGVKIIYVDSPATYPGIITLTTDNELAGKTAAETMLKALKEANIDSGTIGILSDDKDVPNTVLRDKGFREVFKNTDFSIASTVYTKHDSKIIQDSIDKSSEYIGFFTTNQTVTIAAGEHVKNSNSKQILIGFDTDDKVLDMVKDGTIYATIKQNPDIMGYEAIKAAVQTLNGTYTATESVKDTGVEAITKSDL